MVAWKLLIDPMHYLKERLHSGSQGSTSIYMMRSSSSLRDGRESFLSEHALPAQIL